MVPPSRPPVIRSSTLAATASINAVPHPGSNRSVKLHFIFGLNTAVNKDLDQRVDRFIRSSKAFNFPNRVKNSGVMATVVEPADPRRAPPSNVLSQIH